MNVRPCIKHVKCLSKAMIGAVEDAETRGQSRIHAVMRQLLDLSRVEP